MCCDVLIYNTIHYQRVVEAQKSLSFAQRIKNKLRNFGKKKTEPKEKKRPLSEPSLDVEMDDASEQCCKLDYRIDRHFARAFAINFVFFLKNLVPKMSLSDEYEMEVASDGTDNIISNQNIPGRPVCSPPKFFEHLTSFQQNHSQSNGPSLMGNSVDWNNNVLLSKMPTDSKNNQKSSTSFFQMAKNFCGNMMTKNPKPMGNIDLVLDEITNRMALLRFSSILDISAGY